MTVSHLMIFEELQLQEVFSVNTTGTGNGNKALTVLGNPDEIIWLLNRIKLTRCGELCSAFVFLHLLKPVLLGVMAFKMSVTPFSAL